MSDRPIIFSAPMVLALLAGRKTQTRRALKGKSGVLAARSVLQRGAHWLGIEYDRSWPLRLPCARGDRLWVREAHTFEGQSEGECLYRATVAEDTDYYLEEIAEIRWRPSIHMPRWASRLTLHVTEVRVQRLQEISEGDAVAEGFPPARPLPCGGVSHTAGDMFCELWESLHGEGSWDANPWVCAISFTVERANIDQARLTEEPQP